MPGNFTLTLDTQAPASPSIILDGGAAYATAQGVTAAISTSDTPTTGYQIKIWGDVDGTASSSIKPTEGAAQWFAYTTSQAITLSSGDGLKTINMRIRDEVGNETAIVSDTITLDTADPVVTISVAFSPAKISKVSGFDTATGSFSADTAIVAWKVKVVPSADSIHTAGTQIPTTAGSTNVTGGALSANTNQSVSIRGADLEAASAGDGPKIVKVFVQEASGRWSV